MLVEIGTGALLGRAASRAAVRRELEQRERVAAGGKVQALDRVVWNASRARDQLGGVGAMEPGDAQCPHVGAVQQ